MHETISLGRLGGEDHKDWRGTGPVDKLVNGFKAALSELDKDEDDCCEAVTEGWRCAGLPERTSRSTESPAHG